MLCRRVVRYASPVRSRVTTTTYRCSPESPRPRSDARASAAMATNILPSYETSRRVIYTPRKVNAPSLVGALVFLPMPSGGFESGELRGREASSRTSCPRCDVVSFPDYCLFVRKRWPVVAVAIRCRARRPYCERWRRARLSQLRIRHRQQG